MILLYLMMNLIDVMMETPLTVSTNVSKRNSLVCHIILKLIIANSIEYVLVPGIHEIPTAKMVAPTDGRKVRDIDERYIKILQERVTVFPSAHVAPLLANVTMDSDDLKNYDGMFEMIGGNHSREVFQSLIKDPIYGLQQSYHHRLAAVYKSFSDEEALALGKEHNMTAETQLASTFYDDVKLTRHLFSTIQQPSEQKMMGFNDEGQFHESVQD